MDVDSNTNSNNNNNSTNRANDSDTKSKKDTDVRYMVELTRAIKENHGDAITDARFCPFEGGEALYATTASNQVMVYDCEVRGNFISTLLNYRNWHLPTMRTKNVVWKENLERNHPQQLEKKCFNAMCWMKRYREFWIAAADNEKQIHILSITNAKCIKLIKTTANIIDLVSHPMYPNILCTIDEENTCRFINTLNEEIIYVLPDKIHKICFSASGNTFCGVLTNGSVREYVQKMEIVDVDDDMKDVDMDMDMDANVNHNGNNRRNKSNKRLIVNELQIYKFEEKGSNVSDIHYCGESRVIVGNQDGEFKMVNMESIQLLHQWKTTGAIDTGVVCKFQVNKSNDCVVYGNAEHQVLIYDLSNKKYLRKIDTGRGRKLPFSFAAFCRNHPQSVMMVCEGIVMKFDPLELVEDYFPSTADFAVQKRSGKNNFPQVKTIHYEADKVHN